MITHMGAVEDEHMTAHKMAKRHIVANLFNKMKDFVGFGCVGEDCDPCADTRDNKRNRAFKCAPYIHTFKRESVGKMVN